MEEGAPVSIPVELEKPKLRLSWHGAEYVG